MWNTPKEEQLGEIPKLYETEEIPLREKIIHLHFFIGDCDWYIAEYDDNDVFFGFAVQNNDLWYAEWGFASFSELKAVKVGGWLEVDNDLHWVPKMATEVKKIKECYSAKGIAF